MAETLSLSGTGVTAAVTAAETTSGNTAAFSPDVINASGDNLTISVPGVNNHLFGGVTVNGSGDTLSLTVGSTNYVYFQFNGNNDTLSFDDNNRTLFVTVAGTGDTMTGSGANVTLAASSSASLTGSSDSVTVASGTVSPSPAPVIPSPAVAPQSTSQREAPSR